MCTQSQQMMAQAVGPFTADTRETWLVFWVPGFLGPVPTVLWIFGERTSGCRTVSSKSHWILNKINTKPKSQHQQKSINQPVSGHKEKQPPLLATRETQRFAMTRSPLTGLQTGLTDITGVVFGMSPCSGPFPGGTMGC